MEYDTAKLEETILAMLGVSEFENGRVWKRYDFAIMEVLHEKGYISDPHGRAESIHLTETVWRWQRSWPSSTLDRRRTALTDRFRASS